jgi:hypothetical protein
LFAIASSFWTYKQVAPDPLNFLPTAASITHSSDHTKRPRNLEESISRTSLPYSPQSIGDVRANAALEITQQQNQTPVSLCSSNLGFLRSLDAGWSMPVEGSSDTLRLPPLPTLLWKRLDSSTLIPPRPVADSLLDSFFKCAHEFLPIFHKSAFDKQYKELWTSSVRSEPRDSRAHFEDGIFLSTLNVCFALGSLFSELILDEDRETTSDEYYLRSKTLTNFDICDYSALSTVRLQLVTSLYLQTTSNASRCWNVAGLAIRLAQDLGLHKRVSGDAQSDRLEDEMKRRVWYSCIVMDM